jgi:hypothetical protein
MKPQRNKGDAGITNGAGARKSPELNRDEIEKQAYFFWLEGGCQDGCHEDDWFRAELYLSSQKSGVRWAA